MHIFDLKTQEFTVVLKFWADSGMERHVVKVNPGYTLRKRHERKHEKKKAKEAQVFMLSFNL